MDWILAHTHLEGLDTVATIGAGIALTVGFVLGKLVTNFAGNTFQTVLNQARKK